MLPERPNTEVASIPKASPAIRTITLILAVLSIIVFAALARFLYQAETDSIKRDFSAEVAQQALSFEREVLLNLEILFALNASVALVDDLTPERFDQLTGDILSRSPAIQAFAWAEIVTPDTLTAVESRMNEWFPGFSVTERDTGGNVVPVAVRPQYAPVLMIEPIAANQAALGFDLASEPRRLSALLQAMESGKMVATAGITLVQEPDNQRGFLVFAPQFLSPESGTAATGTESRVVFVNGVFRVGELINQSVGNTFNQQVQLQVIDRTRGAEDVLYSSIAAESERWLIAQTVVHDLPDVAGRQWYFEVTPAASLYTERRGYVPWLVLGSGSTVVVLLVVYVLVTQRQNQALNAAKSELERISLTDSMTGLANRRHFDQHLEQQWALAVRQRSALSLVMVDIDNFKPYNDEYGHPEGDAALKQVARALQRMATRPLDLVARYGGEEFALVLPDTYDSTQVAENCRQAVEALGLRHEYSGASDVVTISVGVCSLVPAEGQSLSELSEQADRAMYQAKQEGRNRVVVCSSERDLHRA
ncbi:sensor domain-containing diguanylate cyclase [Saccharospirillum impatiens]|uniref:sensor domain-containing diguanylate cyclase n=1 Tax=Saccharospirillum impatiens TaxID=169438 RepID=UPI0004248B50|nr:diguanylate cyclase [Saccharospirillum impatiens]